MNLDFRRLTYGRCELLSITDQKGNGVVAFKVKFLGRRYVPVIINGWNISEISPNWMSLRKLLFADSKISVFKRWFTKALTEKNEDGKYVNPPAKECSFEFDELTTLYIKPEVPFDAAVFSEYFFTDQRHTSLAQYKGEKHTSEKVFPTARGSAWLFLALKEHNYGIEVQSFSFG